MQVYCPRTNGLTRIIRTFVFKDEHFFVYFGSGRGRRHAAKPASSPRIRCQIFAGFSPTKPPSRLRSAGRLAGRRSFRARDTRASPVCPASAAQWCRRTGNRMSSFIARSSSPNQGNLFCDEDILHRGEKRLHRKVGWEFLPRPTRNPK